MKTIMLLGTTAALALPAFAAATAQEPDRAQCVPALTDGGFALTIRVEGEDGLFRLTCRDGSLVAVPADAVIGQALAPTADATSETAVKKIDASGEAAQSELGASEKLAEPPTELSAAPEGDASDMMASDGTPVPTAPDEQTVAKDAGTIIEDSVAAAQGATGETATAPEPESRASDTEAEDEDTRAPGTASAAINDLIGDTGNAGALGEASADPAQPDDQADIADVPGTDAAVEMDSHDSADANPQDDPMADAISEDDSDAEAGDAAMSGDMAADSLTDDAEDEDAADIIADSADDAASELDVDALDSPPEELTDTARNAAGVAGTMPQSSVTEAPQDAEPSGPATMAEEDGTAEMDKPAVAPEDAAPDGEVASPGEAKQADRLAATEDPAMDETNDAAAPQTSEPDMIAVPLAVIGSAELALPGAQFRSVAIREDGDQQVYALRGQMRSGRDVAVTVAEDGAVVKIDREILQEDVPERILRIAEALMPDAEILRVTLSNRDNYKSFFVFSGLDARGDGFELEIRSDGRSVAFDRPS
ncbi:hypothetical protein SI859A1_01242 [Aurantimonas manganoxydans SI85-9A1]|uniref:PepSY domain-containing protein n=1 Tax=Aurantimonas manganoxydans (strain ATCC BAA-1229 / DSM 21871 / SI85-9A1) TaxID=287752 RepID=Q1YJ77_AURMS|nr:hypothetical protein [Aurantimonas manganoxydans]EAS49890.1 hypothetical protein SI859A1_01242 [Aurantimonas manganoxydans SI85-9A1]